MLYNSRCHVSLLLACNYIMYHLPFSLILTPLALLNSSLSPSMFPKVDIAVDPLDGTTLTAQGRNGAISVRTRKAPMKRKLT